MAPLNVSGPLVLSSLKEDIETMAGKADILDLVVIFFMKTMVKCNLLARLKSTR